MSLEKLKWQRAAQVVVRLTSELEPVDPPPPVSAYCPSSVLDTPSTKTLAHSNNLGPFSSFWLSYLRALKPTLVRSVTRVSDWLIWVHSIIERNTVDLMMNFEWIGKLHVQSENRREIWGSQNDCWEQPLFSDFLLLIVNMRPFEKF